MSTTAAASAPASIDSDVGGEAAASASANGPGAAATASEWAVDSVAGGPASRVGETDTDACDGGVGAAAETAWRRTGGDQVILCAAPAIPPRR